MNTHELTAREWVERARETLDKRTREIDDTQMLDAHDDLCSAIEVLDVNENSNAVTLTVTPAETRDIHVAVLMRGVHFDRRAAKANGPGGATALYRVADKYMDLAKAINAQTEAQS